MRNHYIKEEVEAVVKRSTTWAQVCREVGIKPMTGSQTYLKNIAVKWGIDFSHFIGKAFNKGRKFPEQTRDISYYLVLNGPFINSHLLKQKLIAVGLKENKCEKCGLFEWLGEELPLELDHKNGNHFDNRIENLQILCPNCHAVKTRAERKLHSLGVKEAAVVLETTLVRGTGSTPVESTQA